MFYYSEYRADIKLTPLVETYWAASGFTNSGEVSKVMPDGCVDIIFIFDETQRSFYAKIFGTMTSFFEVSYPQSVKMFGIRFKPAGITAFTRVPVCDFTNRDVELTLVETIFSKDFGEILAEKQSISEIVKYTDTYLSGLLPDIYYSDRQIIRAIDLICRAKGQLSLADLASDICLCPRHFERKFKLATGISPKMFAKYSALKTRFNIWKTALTTICLLLP